MKNNFKKLIKSKGISLIEIIIVIGIISIISAIIIPNLSSFRNQQAMVNTREDIISLLNEARNSTISSKNSTTYGVHFMTNTATLFEGTVFVDSVNNKEIVFNPSVLIPTTGGINLGGGNDVVFKRITGNTLNSGTIVLQLSSDASNQKVISISPVGVITSN